jgi:hypothetical protein
VGFTSLASSQKIPTCFKVCRIEINVHTMAGAGTGTPIDQRIRDILMIRNDESPAFASPHLVEIKFENEPNLDPSNHGQIVDLMMTRAQLLLDQRTEDFPVDMRRPHLGLEGTIACFHHISLNMCRADLEKLLYKSLAYGSELMAPETAAEIAQEILNQALVYQDPSDVNISPDDYPGMEEKEPLRAAANSVQSVGEWAWQLIFGAPEKTPEKESAPAPNLKKKLRSVTLMSTFSTGVNTSSWSSISDCTFDAAILIISPRNAFLLFMIDED